MFVIVFKLNKRFENDDMPLIQLCKFSSMSCEK
jgi:hypothetical protein